MKKPIRIKLKIKLPKSRVSTISIAVLCLAAGSLIAVAGGYMSEARFYAGSKGVSLDFIGVDHSITIETRTEAAGGLMQPGKGIWYDKVKGLDFQTTLIHGDPSFCANQNAINPILVNIPDRQPNGSRAPHARGKALVRTHTDIECNEKVGGTQSASNIVTRYVPLFDKCLFVGLKGMPITSSLRPQVENVFTPPKTKVAFRVDGEYGLVGDKFGRSCGVFWYDEFGQRLLAMKKSTPENHPLEYARWLEYAIVLGISVFLFFMAIFVLKHFRETN